MHNKEGSVGSALPMVTHDYALVSHADHRNPYETEIREKDEKSSKNGQNQARSGKAWKSQNAASYGCVFRGRHQLMRSSFTNNVIASSLNNHGAHVCDVTDIADRCLAVHGIYLCEYCLLSFYGHGQETDATPILNIESQRYEDPEKETTRIRFPFAILLEVDPHNYQRVRFTTKATIYKINTRKKCIFERTGIDTTHMFQFHLDTGSTSKRPDFILDTVFKNLTMSLPAPPIPSPTNLAAGSADSTQKQTAEPASPISLAIPNNESQIVETTI
ncbi:hypothetical protein Tco_1318242 [Tanacetum coccineum]